MLNNETFAAAQQANVKAAVALANKALEGVEQLAALNLKTVRAGFDQAAEAAVAALAAKDPQALPAVQAGFVQPSADAVHIPLQFGIVDDFEFFLHLRCRFFPKLDVLLLGEQVPAGLRLLDLRN